jgi:pimeloyl-ACP methyl ester carboxylesterase
VDAPRSLWLERDGLALHALDFGGHGPPVLLLHGLAGYAGEWAETASWLRESHRVVAPDQRGHGESVRLPPIVTPDAFVGDVTAWIDLLQLAEPSLIGQSYGGLIAFLTAAAHPERVRRLVVAEASPAPDPQAEPSVRAWLESWPRPFADESAAVGFFGGDLGRARVWADGLEARGDGLWPRFDPETLLAALRESAGGHWEAWDAIRCPTLIVRGEHGMPAEEAEAMTARMGSSDVATLRGAGHDVHLEAVAEWRAVVEPFLAAA